MNDWLANASISLLRREAPRLVAATGLFFHSLEERAERRSVESILESYRGGIWGQESTPGLGYPVLRSTNMRGARVEASDPAWCNIPPSQVNVNTLQTGDILVTKSSGSSDLVGKAAIFIQPEGDDTKYLFSNFTLRLRPDQNVVVPEYLAWFLRSPQSLIWRFSTQQTTVGLRNLQTSEFLGQSVPVPPKGLQTLIVEYLNALERNDHSALELELPTYLDGQRRLVARIEALATKIEEARGLRRLAVEEAEALIASEIASVFAIGKQNGWNEGRLGDYVIDDCYGTSEKTTDDITGTPILRMGNIQNGRLDVRDLKYLHLGEKERAKLLLEKGDILVNRTNSAELVGKCAVFDRDGEYSFASYLIRLRLDTSRAEPRLVATYINSPAGRAYMFNERKQMTGQANVNATKLKALPIALPSLEEQRHIVAYLDSLQARVDALKQLQAQTQAELDALLPSVLDRAFKGELL